MADNILDREDIKESHMVPIKDGKFLFDCHPAVPCFTQCCSDLNLALTPYDVLRLKNRLEISSGEFLDHHTTDEVKHNCGLPVVMFRMNNDSRRNCPFLDPNGCSVYEDRPGSCRLYPVARAAKYIGGKVKERHFLVKEPHCLGFQQDREWTGQEWMKDQGLDIYNEMNTLWMNINQGMGERRDPPPITGDKVKMYFMSCYNLDMFRKFVFESTLLKSFQIDRKTIARIHADEMELLKFAFRWIAFAIFGKQTMKVKPALRKAKRRSY
ncbi:MAG: YkgJ family cysteine cluster protein [Deltaproteobacteria bacterium]|nr:MAG: YkgJ family cysteine cluster protein [Deltaproteobacteria bacterium]